MSKIGIIIITYNRPEYFERCLQSFKEADIPANATFILIDDNSTDQKTIQLFEQFNIEGVPIIRYRNKENRKIPYNIKLGFDKAFEIGCEIAMNFDSDAIIKKDAIVKLIECKKKWKDHIVTGFNCRTKNRDGSERHKILEEGEGYNIKKSVGGINFCVNKKAYDKYILPALEGLGNWDHKASINSFNDGKGIVSIVPSVVQHIGVSSSLGHNQEQPDIAYDFYDLHLPNVTLLSVDCINLNHTLAARDQCIQAIQFGAVKVLSSISSHDKDVVKIHPILNKDHYNKFCVKEMNRYIDTDFVLVFQYDGYILNPTAWTEDFLKYDYIGATWGYKDNMNVGNGGFSIRSKKLMDILANDPHITQYYPEDNCICRIYRSYLEQKHGIRFASEELANEFSIEAFGASAFPGGNKYSGQFGFHGWNVDFSNSNIVNKPKQIRR